MKQYKVNVKKLRLMNRKRQQQFEIETKFRIMKLSLGGLNKYRMEYNKIKNSYSWAKSVIDEIERQSSHHTHSVQHMHLHLLDA